MYSFRNLYPITLSWGGSYCRISASFWRECIGFCCVASTILSANSSPVAFSIALTTKPNVPVPKKFWNLNTLLKLYLSPLASSSIKLGIFVTLSISFIVLRNLSCSLGLPTFAFSSCESASSSPPSYASPPRFFVLFPSSSSLRFESWPGAPAVSGDPGVLGHSSESVFRFKMDYLLLSWVISISERGRYLSIPSIS